MPLTSRTRLAKRKHEILEVRKENHTSTSKKHDKRCLENDKESGKETLLMQLKSVQEKYDVLLKENTELKEKVKSMEVIKQQKKLTTCVESQTEWEFQEFPCQYCVYLASCVEELNWHLENDHDMEEQEESEVPSPNTCKICGKKNKNKGELMSHRKNRHPEKIRTCKFYLKGKCDFPESVCWFRHNSSDNSTSTPLSLTEYRCGFCDELFQIKSDFMKHRRKSHEEYVPECRDYSESCCIYGTDACWFKHGEESKKNLENESPDMMARLFNMMEEFSERMKIFESQLYN